jgi:polyhydroxyalkanoate synthesis repressor PhaR
MPLIKRYPNRKLYDTERKKYIKLNDIVSFIQQGNDLQVVENETGEDITSLVLTQILLEERKFRRIFLPLPVLKRLVVLGSDQKPAESAQSEAKTKGEKLVSPNEEESLDHFINGIMELLPIPTKNDLESLSQKVSLLNEKVETLIEASTPENNQG